MDEGRAKKPTRILYHTIGSCVLAKQLSVSNLPQCTAYCYGHLLRSHINFTDVEGTDVTVDVGECVNICNGWVSGFGGLKVIYVYNIKVCQA